MESDSRSVLSPGVQPRAPVRPGRMPPPAIMGNPRGLGLTTLAAALNCEYCQLVQGCVGQISCALLRILSQAWEQPEFRVNRVHFKNRISHTRTVEDKHRSRCTAAGGGCGLWRIKIYCLRTVIFDRCVTTLLTRIRSNSLERGRSELCGH